MPGIDPSWLAGCGDLVPRPPAELSGSEVLVDRSSEYLAAFDPAFHQHHQLVVIGWSLPARLARPMAVVMIDVLVRDRAQVAFAVDQQAVGALGAHRTDPSLGITVRPRCARRRLQHRDPHGGENVIEHGGELGVPIAPRVMDAWCAPAGPLCSVRARPPRNVPTCVRGCAGEHCASTAGRRPEHGARAHRARPHPDRRATLVSIASYPRASRVVASKPSSAAVCLISCGGPRTCSPPSAHSSCTALRRSSASGSIQSADVAVRQVLRVRIGHCLSSMSVFLPDPGKPRAHRQFLTGNGGRSAAPCAGTAPARPRPGTRRPSELRPSPERTRTCPGAA